jgi:glycine dehydrogenase subunit 1
MLYHPWLPNLSQVREMLQEIGVESIEQLFSDIPPDVRLKRELRVAEKEPLSEYQISLLLGQVISMNQKLKYPPFLGGGACPHYIPHAVKSIIGRSEFYTSYTPYQPEVSQGLLQALFEYQSMIAELLEMEVVNASMYDWGSTLGEAALMSYRLNGRRRILVPKAANRYRLEVLKTWARGRGLIVQEYDYDAKGRIDLGDLERKVDRDVSMIYVEQPNYFGVLEDSVEAVVDATRKVGAISAIGVKPVSLGILKPPGEYGFDIAIGDAQELGIPLNFGGPYAGIFAVRWDARLVRQMPGRIVGMTTDVEGREAFTLILQTREQFARREKATSNITTNESLMAIAAAIMLALLGPVGIKELAEEILSRSRYAYRKILKEGGGVVFDSDFYEEFLVSIPNYETIHSNLLSNGIHGGRELEKGVVQFCVTEVHTKRMIDELVSRIGESIVVTG